MSWRMDWFAAVVLPVLVGCAANPSVPPTPLPPAAIVATAAEPDIAREVVRLRAALLHEVPQHTATQADSDEAWIRPAKAMLHAAGFAVDRVQLLVVVDCNARVQELRIVLARPDGPWQVIGGSKVSTGQAGRRGYFITPVGVFLHTDGILDTVRSARSTKITYAVSA